MKATTPRSDDDESRGHAMVAQVTALTEAPPSPHSSFPVIFLDLAPFLLRLASFAVYYPIIIILITFISLVIRLRI